MEEEEEKEGGDWNKDVITISWPGPQAHLNTLDDFLELKTRFTRVFFFSIYFCFLLSFLYLIFRIRRLACPCQNSLE